MTQIDSLIHSENNFIFLNSPEKIWNYATALSNLCFSTMTCGIEKIFSLIDKINSCEWL